MKISIAKVCGASFENKEDYMLQNLKMMLNQIIFKTPTQLQMIGFLSIFVHLQSLFLLLFYISPKYPLKYIENTSYFT